ncbi:MAG: enoyl-CoA hydratase-related protein [Pseudomonadota bacterium]
MTENSLVQLSCQGPIATVTLNDPSRLNVLSRAMINSLKTRLEDASQTPGVHVIMLRAYGRAFCAGHDLGELAMGEGGDSSEATKALFEHCVQLMTMLPTLPQPVIAAVQGVATAAGCQLVASCDLAVASEDAKFGLNGIDVGLFCYTPMVAASRAMMPRKCFEMLVSGNFLSAVEACAAGLINRTVAADQLETETLSLANTIAAKDPEAIALGKAAFYKQLQEPLKQAYATGREAILRNLTLPETQRQIAGFGQKRKTTS